MTNLLKAITLCNLTTSNMISQRIDTSRGYVHRL